MSRSVGIIIPSFRPDVDTLERYVEGIETSIEPDRVRIELDAPGPETKEAVERLERTITETAVTVNTVDRRRGKGAAITAGFEALDTDVLAFADDDGSTLAPSLDRVIERVRTGETDLAIAARYHSNSWVHESLHRNLNGKCFAWTCRRFLPVAVSDYQCGAKAIDREAWTAVRDQLREPGFAWDLDLLAMTHTLGYEIEEVPVNWIHDPRSRAESVSTAAELLRSLVTVRHRSKRLSGDPLHRIIGDQRENQRPLIETLLSPRERSEQR